VEVEQINEGLWRWTTRHPEWTPEADWPAEVGCVYYETSDAVVLIDPLIPQDDAERERFLRALDRDVSASGGSVHLLRTVRWHNRSIEDLRERFGASVWSEDTATDPPAGVEAFRIEPAEESILWLGQHGAVVSGDALIGDDAGGIRMCPESWLAEGRTHGDLAAALRPLLDLPVERLLVSHGQPVLAGGREALANALPAR
jgi:glyoxylase-like metal-dependent hydrolase (beta-lactamase superfamily II)